MCMQMRFCVMVATPLHVTPRKMHKDMPHTQPTCADPEGGGRGSGPPLKNHKIIGFPSNTGPDPLKNLSHQASI